MDWKRKDVLGIVSIMTLSMLPGCTTTFVGNFCEVYDPVYYNLEEVPKSVADQILPNNAYYKEQC